MFHQAGKEWRKEAPENISGKRNRVTCSNDIKIGHRLRPAKAIQAATSQMSRTSENKSFDLYSGGVRFEFRPIYSISYVILGKC